MKPGVNRVWLFLLACGALILPAQSMARADFITYSGSSGSLSASAKFELTGTDLLVTLTNTSSSDVLVPADVLAGLFFNTSKTLTPVVLGSSILGSSVFYAAIANNVGEGWAYKSGISQYGKNTGLGAAGFGIFANGDIIDQANKVTPLDGIDYGILSAGDSSGTGNTGVTGKGPLIKNAVQFEFTVTGAASVADLGLGASVTFQYGSAVNNADEPSFESSIIPVPEPASITMAAFVAMGFAGYRLRRRKMAAASV